MASSTVEDYIKQILLLEQSLTSDGHTGGLVALGQLSVAMGVVPGTVTTMVKALADAGLVEYEPRRGVKLTAGGEKLALHVLRRHRLIEQFLVKVLKFDWSEVHEEAEALEHALSDKVVDRLDEMLGYPQVDPHGDPIPTGAGRVNVEKSRPLKVCLAGEEVRIIRVMAEDAAFLRYAEKQGLMPGARLRVERCEAGADAVTVVVEGGSVGPITLGLSAAGRLLVSV